MTRLHLRLVLVFALTILTVGSLAMLLMRPLAHRAVHLSLRRTAAQISGELGRIWEDRERVDGLVEERGRRDDVRLAVLDRAGVLVSGSPPAPPPEFAVPGPPPRRSPPRFRRDPPPHHPRFHVEVPVLRGGEAVGTLVVAPLSPERLVERALLTMVLPVSLVSLVVAALALWPVTLRMTRRLRDLEAVSHRLERGDLSVRARVRGNDEIERLAVRFNAMAETLEEQQRGRRRFFQAISHEIRSPLARLRVALSVLRESPSPGEREICLSSAERDIREVGDLVDNLLEVARGTEGRPPLQLGSVDVEGLSRALAEPLGLRLTVEGAVPTVTADAVLLGRAIRNVLENAVRYAGQDKPVELNVEEAGDDIRLRFRDHGPGIPERHRERVFEPFYRPDDARTRATGGVGLGLALVRQAMEQHGGTARIEAAEGGGTAVVLVLPRRPGMPRGER